MLVVEDDAQLHVCERNVVTERHELGGPLGAHHAGDARHRAATSPFFSSHLRT